MVRLLWWQRQGSVAYSHPPQSVGKYSWTVFPLHSPHELLLKDAEKRQPRKRQNLSPAGKGRGLWGSHAPMKRSLLLNLELFWGTGHPPGPFPFFWLCVFLGKTVEYILHPIACLSFGRSLNDYFHWQMFIFSLFVSKHCKGEVWSRRGTSAP